jgi:CheY-like chemotaxis protein
MTFVVGGREALSALEARHYDVLITDLRMPAMNGVELLLQVLEHYPHVIRMALSGHAERETVVRAVGLAHQFLSKPCDADLFKLKLAQALRLRTLLDSPTLTSLLSRVSSVRTVPALYAQLTAEMQSASPSTTNVATIVARDPGMTAKVLQLINSAYFGLRAHVSDPVRAVQLLDSRRSDQSRSPCRCFHSSSARWEAQIPSRCGSTAREWPDSRASWRVAWTSAKKRSTKRSPPDCSTT